MSESLPNTAYGDFLAHVIRMMERETQVGRAWEQTPPGHINVIDAARVALKFYEEQVFGGPEPHGPYLCPLSNPDCENITGGLLPCMCMTDEQVAMMWAHLADLEEEKQARGNRCPYCGNEMEWMHQQRFHPEMRMGGHRVWRTVWHGWRDI